MVVVLNAAGQKDCRKISVKQEKQWPIILLARFMFSDIAGGKTAITLCMPIESIPQCSSPAKIMAGDPLPSDSGSVHTDLRPSR